MRDEPARPHLRIVDGGGVMARCNYPDLCIRHSPEDEDGEPDFAGCAFLSSYTGDEPTQDERDMAMMMAVTVEDYLDLQRAVERVRG